VCVYANHASAAIFRGAVVACIVSTRGHTYVGPQFMHIRAASICTALECSIGMVKSILFTWYWSDAVLQQLFDELRFLIQHSLQMVFKAWAQAVAVIPYGCDISGNKEACALAANEVNRSAGEGRVP